MRVQRQGPRTFRGKEDRYSSEIPGMLSPAYPQHEVMHRSGFKFMRWKVSARCLGQIFIQSVITALLMRVEC